MHFVEIFTSLMIRINRPVPHSSRVLSGLPAKALRCIVSTSNGNEVTSPYENLSSEDFAKIESKIIDKTEREESILNRDNLFQMDVSSGPVHDIRKGSKIFWRTVQIVQSDRKNHAGDQPFYEIQLDGRRVRAFEGKNNQNILLPSKDYAYAVAREWATQARCLNQTLMPMSDIASAASYHVNHTGIPPRIEYLVSFLRNDNTFYRAPKLEKEQDARYGPIHAWFEETFGVKKLPRIENIKYSNLPEETAEKIQGVLTELELNTYQIIALCVLCQYTSSLILPLAHLFTSGKLISMQDLITISNLEEKFNVGQHGSVEGYHDFREKEAKLKISAAVCVWKLTSGLSTNFCIPE